MESPIFPETEIDMDSFTIIHEIFHGMEHFLISIPDSGCDYDESFDMSVCIRMYYIRSIRSFFLSAISIERSLLPTQCNQLHSLEQLPLSLCTYPFLNSYSICVNPICQSYM